MYGVSVSLLTPMASQWEFGALWVLPCSAFDVLQ